MMNKKEIKAIVREEMRKCQQLTGNFVIDWENHKRLMLEVDDITTKCKDLYREYMEKFKDAKKDWVIEEKKEWPQEGDEDWTVYCDLGRVQKLPYTGDETSKNNIESGNGFETRGEAEAMWELRKHEAKCRFTMEDFDNEHYVCLPRGNDIIVQQVYHNPAKLNVVECCAFPSANMAQERADILKRLAKIRNLI